MFQLLFFVSFPEKNNNSAFVAIDNIKMITDTNEECPLLPDGFNPKNPNGDCDFHSGFCSWTNANEWERVTGANHKGPGPKFDRNQDNATYFLLDNNNILAPADVISTDKSFFKPQCFQFHFALISKECEKIRVSVLEKKYFLGFFSYYDTTVWQIEGGAGDWEFGQVPVNVNNEYRIQVHTTLGSKSAWVAVDDFKFNNDVNNCPIFPPDADPSNGLRTLCEFETDTCNYTLSEPIDKESFAWIRTNPLQQLTKGPEYDHMGRNGYYLLASSFSSQSTSAIAMFESNFLYRQDLCVSFRYQFGVS